MNFIAVWKVGYRDEIEWGISSEEAIVISTIIVIIVALTGMEEAETKQAIQAQEAFWR